jgi:hypothetical protein
MSLCFKSGSIATVAQKCPKIIVYGRHKVDNLTPRPYHVETQIRHFWKVSEEKLLQRPLYRSDLTPLDFPMKLLKFLKTFLLKYVS